MRPVSHTIRRKSNLAARTARIRGQIDAIARAIETDADCGDLLRLIASARGAMNGLMAEVAEDHVRAHVFQHAAPESAEARAAEDLVEIVRSYLK